MLTLSHKQRRILAVSLMVVAALYLAAVGVTGYDAFIHAAARLGWSGWLLILCCSFFNYCLRFLRWTLYLRKLEHQLPTWLHFHYYMSAFALTTTPGKSGETIRSLYLHGHGVPYTHSLAMFFTERFLDVIIITLLAALALLSFKTYGTLTLLAVALLLLLLPLLRSEFVVRTLQYIAATLPGQRLPALTQALARLLQSARELLHWRMLYSGLGLGLIAWLIQAVAFYFIVTTLDLPLDFSTATAIYATGLLAGALSFIPGGIGATEAVMGLLLINAGADPSTAVSAPIISRISTLWFAVCLGLLSSSYLGARGKQNTTAYREIV